MYIIKNMNNIQYKQTKCRSCGHRFDMTDEREDGVFCPECDQEYSYCQWSWPEVPPNPTEDHARYAFYK